MIKPNILVLSKKNISDFAFERNEMLKKSKYKWNLFLDNDEKIETSNFDIDDNYSGYYLLRKNYFLNHFIGSEKIIRLVQKNKGKFVRSVHEYWKPNAGLMIGEQRNIIVHHTASNLNTYLDKINKYSTIHAIENKKEGKRVTLFKVIVYPVLKFILTLIKSKNVVFGIMQSFHSFLSWSKMYLKEK